MFKRLWNKFFAGPKYTVYLVIALGGEYDCEEVIVGTYDFEAARQFGDVYTTVHKRATYVKAIDVL